MAELSWKPCTIMASVYSLMRAIAFIDWIPGRNAPTILL
jgi:hypothetical protein